MVLIFTDNEILNKDLNKNIENSRVVYYPDYILEEKEANVLIATLQPNKYNFKDFMFKVREKNIRVILILENEQIPELKDALFLGIYDFIFDPFEIEDIKRSNILLYITAFIVIIIVLIIRSSVMCYFCRSDERLSFMEKQIHGGNTYDKEVSLDFSVNINPLGMPDGVQDAILNNMSGYETYPDIRYTAFREAVAGKERVQADRILCGNGASELIMAVVRAEKPYKCAVAAPSFSGYERAVSAYGAETEYYKLDEKNGFGYADACSQLKDMDIQMCFICNPNNPTGITIPQDLLEEILETCAMQGIFMVVDECFLDFVKDPEKYTLKGKLEKGINQLAEGLAKIPYGYIR